MAEIKISNKDWERIKIKIQRKYNNLTDSELQYTEGNEEALIANLMNIVIVIVLMNLIGILLMS